MPLLRLIEMKDGECLPPAAPAALRHLAERAESALGTSLPADYLGFLARADGAFADGLVIYPSCQQAGDGLIFPGVIEINLARRNRRPELAPMIILGEIDDDFLIYKPGDGSFWSVDRPSLDPYEHADSFTQLAMQVLLRLG